MVGLGDACLLGLLVAVVVWLLGVCEVVSVGIEFVLGIVPL
jgi:hypothetical protein